MPFELTNALAALMDLMNMMFHSYLNQFIVVFVDAILIYSKSKEDHERHLHLALQLLRSQQLYVKFSKIDFWMEQVTFLGHVDI